MKRSISVTQTFLPLAPSTTMGRKCQPFFIPLRKVYMLVNILKRLVEESFGEFLFALAYGTYDL
ncbi:MAG: hypothetical protein LBG19_06290 [Prevotellaceae bacterium]|nr:hypothetical protein [Prevotellaceae bacterium]